MAMLTYRDPFLASPARMMDEILRGWNGERERLNGFTPLLDVRETHEDYLVLVDLPGVRAEDVTIEVTDQVLTISGSRVPAESGAQLTERPSGSFVRTLTLPKGVEDDKIVAEFNDGVLQLHVPKPAEQRPKKITIGGAGSQQAIGT